MRIDDPLSSLLLLTHKVVVCGDRSRYPFDTLTHEQHSTNFVVCRVVGTLWAEFALEQRILQLLLIVLDHADKVAPAGRLSQVLVLGCANNRAALVVDSFGFDGFDCGQPTTQPLPALAWTCRRR